MLFSIARSFIIPNHTFVICTPNKDQTIEINKNIMAIQQRQMKHVLSPYKLHTICLSSIIFKTFKHIYPTHMHEIKIHTKVILKKLGMP